MRLFLTISFFFTFQFAKAQDLLYVNEKSYPSSGSFHFAINSDDYAKQISVMVAKDGEKGILALSVATIYETEIISGKILLYLADGTVITLLDKNINDNVDGYSTTIRYLTSVEVKKLIESDIVKIRFSKGLKGFNEKSNLTASNIEYVSDRSRIPAMISTKKYFAGFF